jgi:hypothetical protein
MATVPKKTIRWANNEEKPLEEIKEFSKKNLVELPPPLIDTIKAIDKEISKLPWTNSNDIVVSLELATTILDIIEKANNIGYSNKKIDALIIRLNKILDTTITLDKIKAYIPKYHNYNKNNGAGLIAEYEAILQRRDIITKKTPVAEKKEAEKEVVVATKPEVVATKPEIVAEKVESQVAAEPEVVEKFQATNLPTLLNIAGEIINLSISTKSGNSGRMNLMDFYANFTKDENEVMILTKVFGIRSLRDTPSILTEEGCSLTDDEKKIVTKILEKRKKTLEEGLSLTRGILADTTRMKISRLKLLLKRIDGGFDSALPCQPSESVVTPILPKSMPSMSMPSWMRGQNKSTEELLISLFLLLIGISSEKIKAKNVQDRLAPLSIDSLLEKLRSKKLTPANIESTSSKLQEIIQELYSVPKVSEVPEAEDAQNITQFGKMVQDYTAVEAELHTAISNKADKEAEKKGAQDAQKFIENLLKIHEGGLKDIQGRHADTINADAKAELKESMDTKTALIKIFRDKLSALNTNLLTLTGEIKELTDTVEKLDDKLKKLKNLGEAGLNEMKTIAANKEKAIETEIRQKSEELAAQKKLLADLSEKKAPTDTTSAEIKKTETDIEKLEKEVTNLKERNKEMESEFKKLVSKTPSVAKDDGGIAEKESLRLRIDALEAAYEKTNDSEIGKELIKLKGALTSKLPGSDKPSISINNVAPPTTNANRNRLNSFLDNNNSDANSVMTNEESRGGGGKGQNIDSVLDNFLFQAALIEKDDERFCLLYYFITYFWKSVRDNLAEPAERDYLDRLDKLYFPDMKRNEFWPTIILIAKIIHKMRSIANEKVAVLTSDMITLLDKLNGIKGTQDQLLESIYQQVDIFLPQSPVFALKEDGAWKLQRAPSQECSILQMGPLYLLLMKVTHRYIYNIIEESPNRLKCQSRLNPSL